ncbi:MAG: hypothetical protein LBL15_04370 [Oscillospiraceae bacterium]|nr:hypothetical protein [Oscillospiraceae bacterium]
MEIWWESLTVLEKTAACIAFPATLILLIQTLMQLFGLGGGAGEELDIHDGDASHIDLYDGEAGDTQDGSEPADSGLRVFTVRGYVTFFTVFGWGFLALSRSGTAQSPALVIAFILGVFALVLTGLILCWSMKLQADGTVKFSNAVGQTGRVYLSIPPSRSGPGKVNVVIQERYSECDAVTDEETAIETGSEVVVMGVTGHNMLIVRRKRLANHT